MIRASTLATTEAARPLRLRGLADLIPGLLLPVLLVINPIVVQQVTPINRSVVYYLVALDLTCLLALALHVAARGSRARSLHYASLFWVLTIPIQLLLLEIGVFYQGFQLGPAEGYVAEDGGGGLYVADDRLGWTPRPGAVVRHRLPDNYDVTYRIDAQGLRAHATSPGARMRVHVFGDSFTFGQGVEDDQTYPALLQQALGPAYEVINYGVNGYGPEQMDLRMERYAGRIAPGDLVLWAPISEDLARSFVDPRYICALAASQLLRIEVAPMLGRDGFEAAPVGERCTGLDVFLGGSFLPFANLVNTVLDWFRHPRLIANAERILARAEALSAARGARFALIFLVQPGECLSHAYTFDPTGLEQAYQSLFAACPIEPAAIHRLHFAADGHWTPAGHRWAAQALLDLLRAPDGPLRSDAAARDPRRDRAPVSRADAGYLPTAVALRPLPSERTGPKTATSLSLPSTLNRSSARRSA